jgi:hypothetical protein
VAVRKHSRRFGGVVQFKKEFVSYNFGRARCPSHVNMIHRSGRPEISGAVFVLLALWLASVAFGADANDVGGQRKLDPRLPKYFMTKEREARALAKQLNLQVQPEVWDYFAAGSKSDWATANKLFDGISRKWRQGENTSAMAGPVLEAVLAYEGFSSMEMKFVESFARDIIDSIPPGSIYFGGTDPGRGLVTAFVKSLPEAKPFFVLSQNPLGDKTYLDYVRAMYGQRLYIPSAGDWQKALDDYAADAKARMDADKLKPGENVSEGDNDKLKPASNVAWMEVNALLAKIIFEKNPVKEFYIEESMPMDWMYPHLSPHGLILKLNRKPLATLSEKIVADDHEYWREQTKRLIGDWLTNETPVKVLCEFLENVYVEKNLDGFKGDEDYVANRRGRNGQIIYGHLRMGQAHVYEWQMNHITAPEEKKRMLLELDFAYRQSIALNPYDVEKVKRYVSLLRDQERLDDARQMLKVGRTLHPRSTRLQELATELN